MADEATEQPRFLVTPDEVATRAGHAGALTDDERALATSAIEQVTAMAEYYSGIAWSLDPELVVPPVAKAIILEVSARIFGNPDGYALERGDAVTLSRGDNAVVGLEFRPDERAVLEDMKPVEATIYSMDTYNDDTPYARSYGKGGAWINGVPFIPAEHVAFNADRQSDPFPWIALDDPWWYR